ncbi:MAG TPA: hypothetical protein DEB40_08360 [Elusimicrobia bacterium]|nr:hypothetical protein [Elusimicrobiota bacterium]HBT61741.1 hypothetical protein [Elusimicrobiota bacterium]
MKTEARFWLGACAAAVAAAGGQAWALTTHAAENTSQFLALGAGGRALGMGEAYGPVAEGPEAIYWNPAGLAALKRPAFIYARSEFMRFFHHDFAAYAQPVAALRGTLAASFARFSQDSLPVVTNANETTGSFSPHGEAVAVAYALDLGAVGLQAPAREYFREVRTRRGYYRTRVRERESSSGRVLLGVAAKFVNETIYTRNSAAVAMDGGVLYRPAVSEDLRLSLSFRNVGSRQNFGRENEDLPAEAGMGAAYGRKSKQGYLLAAFELGLPYYGNPYGKAGVEYRRYFSPGMSAALRLGYKTLTATDLNPITGITGGIGIGYKKYTLDFGFQPMADLGETYRMSISARW